MKKVALKKGQLGLIALLILVDQIVKIWTKNNVLNAFYIPWTKHLISITYLKNSGAAWSLFSGDRNILIFIGFLAVCFLVWFFLNKFNAIYNMGFVFILSGSIGNLLDRVLYGYVVDMFRFNFINFPIFNMADIYLTIGVICLVIAILKDFN